MSNAISKDLLNRLKESFLITLYEVEIQRMIIEIIMIADSGPLSMKLI